MNCRWFCFLKKDAWWVVTLAVCLLLMGTFVPVAAQVPVTLAPLPQLQFFDQSGLPLAFGCVFTNQVGSATPLVTYTDFTGKYQNSNPVILSAGGSANIWILPGQAYRFIVKGNGGTNCSLGTTLYTVDGIGGGTTQLTTIVPYSATPTFTDASQNQLFAILLTGNATAQPLTAVGVISPGYVSWQITQDNSGGHNFSWPANTVGGPPICTAANCVTQQMFLWNGTNATAVGPAQYSSNGAFAALNLYDFGLSASLPVCTSAGFLLTSTCAGLIPNADLVNSSVTLNGQAVSLGGSGNVNAGAAAHSLATNEGAGAAMGGVALSVDQVAVGASGADPNPTSLCNGNLSYSTSSHGFTCNSNPQILAKATATSCALASNNGEWNCSATFSWGATLANSTYYPVCQISVPLPTGSFAIPAGYDANLYVLPSSISTTGFTYFINDDHSGSSGAVYTIWCQAIE